LAARAPLIRWARSAACRARSARAPGPASLAIAERPGSPVCAFLRAASSTSSAAASTLDSGSSSTITSEVSDDSPERAPSRMRRVRLTYAG
jgi:hypothetical protein